MNARCRLSLFDGNRPSSFFLVLAAWLPRMVGALIHFGVIAIMQASFRGLLHCKIFFATPSEIVAVGWCGRVNVVEYLLDSGINVNILFSPVSREPRPVFSPLYQALALQKAHVCQERAGRQVGSVNDFGRLGRLFCHLQNVCKDRLSGPRFALVRRQMHTTCAFFT